MISIRRMKEEDLPAVSLLERECFSEPWSKGMFLESLRNPLYRFFTAEEDGGVIGYAGMYIVLDEGNIVNIAVSPGKRRQGIADGMMDLLIFEASRAGAELLHLEVREHNEAARHLYEKKGFTEVGRRKSYYHLPEEDAILYTRKRGSRTTCSGQKL